MSSVTLTTKESGLNIIPAKKRKSSNGLDKKIMLSSSENKCYRSPLTPYTHTHTHTSSVYYPTSSCRPPPASHLPPPPQSLIPPLLRLDWKVGFTTINVAHHTMKLNFMNLEGQKKRKRITVALKNTTAIHDVRVQKYRHI